MPELANCRTCNRNFQNDDALNNHNSHFHNHCCGICKKSFRTSEGRNQHIEARHTVSCVHCNSKFKTNGLLIKHMKERHKNRHIPIQPELQPTAKPQPSQESTSKAEARTPRALQVSISSASQKKPDVIKLPEARNILPVSKVESATGILEPWTDTPTSKDTPVINISEAKAAIAKPDNDAAASTFSKREAAPAIKPHITVSQPAVRETPAFTTCLEKLTAHVTEDYLAWSASHDEVFNSISTGYAEETAVEPLEPPVVSISKPDKAAPLTRCTSIGAAVAPRLPNIPELSEDNSSSHSAASEFAQINQAVQSLKEPINLSQLTKCNICQGLFTSIEVYDAHNVEAHKIMCMVCLVSFESSSAIIKHWNEAHRDIPQQSHFSEESLSFWEKLMDGTEGSKSERVEEQADTLVEALLEDTNDSGSEEIWYCKECDLYYETEEDLHVHTVTYPFHAPPILDCIECPGLVFETQIQLLQHINSKPHNTKWVISLTCRTEE